MPKRARGTEVKGEKTKDNPYTNIFEFIKYLQSVKKDIK